MEQRRHAPPWLFGITYIPFGVVGGFCMTTLPFLTRKAGLSVENIGWFVALTQIPPMLQFLYAPVVDLGPKRKHWLVIVTLLGAACLFAAMTMPLPSHVGAFLAFTIAGQLISGLIGSASGGLLATTMPDQLRGAAGGWMNAGNLGGGALGFAVAGWLTNLDARPVTLGAALAALMIVPSVASLALVEPERERRAAGELFGTMIRDVWRVAKSRPGWTGILISLSPVGSSALLYFFSAAASDYHASDGMVTFVNGPMNGLLTAAGSLVGGYACDHLNRRLAYLGSGALTALCGLAMSFAPSVPMTYAVGVCAYLFIAGICYATFSAMVLESIGQGGEAASTQYTLFTAAANGAIGYVQWIDTRFHHRWGAPGLLRVDAAMNLGGIVIMAIVFFVFMGRNRAVEEPRTVAA
jgi:MFS family permease